MVDGIKYVLIIKDEKFKFSTLDIIIYETLAA